MRALIAGAGRLPTLIKRTHEGPLHVVALDDFPPDDLVPNRVFCIEHLGSLLDALVSEGIKSVCFAGSIARPPIDPSKIDAATMPLVPAMMEALQQGDDAALRTVVGFFEDRGIEVIAAHDIVPELLPPAGVHTEKSPDAQAESDAARAADIGSCLGAADIGQALVVRKGHALAIEGPVGTDWMLASLIERPDTGGGLLFKSPKPDQDRRIDLPTIGPATIKAAADAKLDGIVVETGGVLVLDLEATIKAANDAEVFLWVRDR